MKHKYKKFRKKVKKRDLFFLIFKSRYFGLTLLFLAIGGIVFYFSIFSSLFQVKNIRVFGNEKVSTGDIKNAVLNNIARRIIFFDTKSIFLANFKKAEKVILNNFLKISQVKLKRHFFNTVLIRIKERKAVAVFCQGLNDCFLIDKKGKIFEKTEGKNSGLEIRQNGQVAVLNLGAQAVDKKRMSQILDIKTKIEENFKIPLRRISIISDARLNIKTKEGWEIHFSLEKDLDWQITELDAILKKISSDKRKTLKYIDLRFNKVYISPEGLLN